MTHSEEREQLIDFLNWPLQPSKRKNWPMPNTSSTHCPFLLNLEILLILLCLSTHDRLTSIVDASNVSLVCQTPIQSISHLL